MLLWEARRVLSEKHEYRGYVISLQAVHFFMSAALRSKFVLVVHFLNLKTYKRVLPMRSYLFNGVGVFYDYLANINGNR